MKNEKVEILLVEDNPHEAWLTINSLQEHNLANHLLHLDDGAEALDFIFAKGKYSGRKITNLPRVILLDLNLPKIGGLEVLRQIKQSEMTRHVPVVILTSSKQDRDVIAGYQAGVNSYIVKPVDFDVFSKAISDLGMYWVGLNEAGVTHSVPVPNSA